MLMTEKEYEEREVKISRIISLTLEHGSYSDSRHQMYLTNGTYEIRVCDLLDQSKLVAFSSTKADFENSLVEFAEDYFA